MIEVDALEALCTALISWIAFIVAVCYVVWYAYDEVRYDKPNRRNPFK